MAVTSIWRVNGRLGKVVVYAENPDKTTNPKCYENGAMTEWDCQDLDEVISYAVSSHKTQQVNEELGNLERFVSGINCNPSTAREEMMAVKKRFGKEDGTIAYHGYQSFAPGEATPEIAHQIGVALARRLWGEKYQVVVATHLDKANHLHNHFVLNTVSFVDGKKYFRSAKDYHDLQREPFVAPIRIAYKIRPETSQAGVPWLAILVQPDENRIVVGCAFIQPPRLDAEINEVRINAPAAKIGMDTVRAGTGLGQQQHLGLLRLGLGLPGLVCHLPGDPLHGFHEGDLPHLNEIVQRIVAAEATGEPVPFSVGDFQGIMLAGAVVVAADVYQLVGFTGFQIGQQVHLPRFFDGFRWDEWHCVSPCILLGKKNSPYHFIGMGFHGVPDIFHVMVAFPAIPLFEHICQRRGRFQKGFRLLG